MKKRRFILAVSAAICILSGCGSLKVPEGNVVSIQKDGSIKQTIVEQFERNYYDVDELEAMAKEKIAAFNSGIENIVCDSVRAKDGKVIVEMTYLDGDKYTEFNHRELFFGTVNEAIGKGYSVKDATAQDGTEIDEEQLLQLGENHIVVIQTKEGEALNVQVYDKILYTSGNIISTGKKDVYIEEEGEDMLSYIIF